MCSLLRGLGGRMCQAILSCSGWWSICFQHKQRLKTHPVCAVNTVNTRFLCITVASHLFLLHYCFTFHASLTGSFSLAQLDQPAVSAKLYSYTITSLFPFLMFEHQVFLSKYSEKNNTRFGCKDFRECLFFYFHLKSSMCIYRNKTVMIWFK